MYRQDFRGVDHLKYVLLHCWVLCGQVPGRLQKRAAMAFRVHSIDVLNCFSLINVVLSVDGQF